MGRLNWVRLVILVLLAWGWLGTAAPLYAQGDLPVVVTVRLEGPLNPIWQETLKRAMRTAEERGAEALILELDTPGGQIDVMNRLIQQIRNSPVPVVVYVSPAGAMAASAGAMLTLAGHAAAMAPETSIGAASPVGGQGEDIGETMESKVKEILKASARGLTLRRGESAVRLAEEMIENARAVSASEAVENGLVDLVAPDLPTLLRKLDGLSIEFGDSQRTLRTAGAVVVEVPLTFMEQVLVVLANPNLVFLLLSIGVQAILIELSSPGGWVAGFIGAVCVTLAVFGLGILPVNWFGIIFLVMAFILFVLD
ncbi:nodulation protein NfeD, partial [uncultured Anaerolinea sp.]